RWHGGGPRLPAAAEPPPPRPRRHRPGPWQPPTRSIPRSRTDRVNWTGRNGSHPELVQATGRVARGPGAEGADTPRLGGRDRRRSPRDRCPLGRGPPIGHWHFGMLVGGRPTRYPSRYPSRAVAGWLRRRSGAAMDLGSARRSRRDATMSCTLYALVVGIDA